MPVVACCIVLKHLGPMSIKYKFSEYSAPYL